MNLKMVYGRSKTLVNICCEDTEDFSHQLVKVKNILRLHTSDPNDNESITPNHLLLLGPRGHVFSPVVFSSKDEICRKQYNKQQY
jgi:hypothetical protein